MLPMLVSSHHRLKLPQLCFVYPRRGDTYIGSHMSWVFDIYFIKHGWEMLSSKPLVNQNG